MKTKKELKKIKAIVFDVGGVLALSNVPEKVYRGHTHFIGFHEYVAKKFNIYLDQWFDAIDTTYAKSITGELSRKRVVSIISKNVKKTPKKFEKIIKKAYKKNFKQNNQLYRLANRLRKKGYKIGILSDQWHLSKEALILQKKIKKFNLVLVSCDIGIRKPNPKIYKLLIKKLKLKPQEILFIDNQEWNIKPAKRLKIKTLLYKDNKQLIKGLKKNAVII